MTVSQIRDTDAVREMCQEVIASNPNEAKEYRAGKTRKLKHLVGQLMKLSKGRADPKLGSTVLKELLDES